MYAHLDDPAASENVKHGRAAVLEYVDAGMFWEQPGIILRYGVILA